MKVLWLYFAGATLAALALGTLLQALYRRFFGSANPEADELDISLAKKFDLRHPNTWEGKFDLAFDKLIRWTLLGISTSQVVTMVFFLGALAASITFLLTEDLLFTAIALLAAILLPMLFFFAMRHRWRTAFQEQLPEACFLLARSLRAGLNLERAFRSVAEHSPQPLALEFERSAQQIELGLSVQKILERQAEEIQLPDYDVLLLVLRINHEMGGNLPALLDRLAATFRSRNHFRGHFKAATTLNRATSFFIASAAPIIGLIYYFAYPDLFRNFFESTLGLTLFGLAVVLEIVGILWVMWLLRRVDY